MRVCARVPARNGPQTREESWLKGLFCEGGMDYPDQEGMGWDGIGWVGFGSQGPPAVLEPLRWEVCTLGYRSTDE